MIKEYKKFHDRIVVIAGGASGMGEHTARKLSSVAKTIIILDRNSVAGNGLLRGLGESSEFYELEMKNSTDVQDTLSAIVQKHGIIDYFFNFAGSFLAGEIRDTPVKEWGAIFDNNLKPIINATTSVYEIMQKNGGGHIINVASAAGLFPTPVMNIYGATKSAVISLTLGLRVEARKFNIDVSVVCPTVVDTPLYETAAPMRVLIRKRY